MTTITQTTVSWPNSHFDQLVRKLDRTCCATFSRFYRICHFNYVLVLCGCWSSNGCGSSVVAKLWLFWLILTCVTCFEIVLSIGSYFLFMLAKLNYCFTSFASNHQFVLCLTMTHSAMQTRAHNDSGTPPKNKHYFGVCCT